MFGKKKPGLDEPDTLETPVETAPDKPNPLSRRFESGDESPTVMLDEAHNTETATRILTPTEQQKFGQAVQESADPPVAVLVITSGPGLGRVVTMGYGMNSLGREATERISLDFGDQRISRTGQASLTYDRESQRYFVQHGGGPNLTYLNGEPVLEPMEMCARNRIKVGDTELLLLPLCGLDFDWQEPADQAPVS